MSIETPTALNYGAAPETIGHYDLPSWQEFMHYMYLPIGFPEIDSSIRLPERLQFAEDLIGATLAEEAKRGNQWKHIYLTARRGYATPGNPLNRPGWHADGFGTEDINYVWTDRYPTLFAVQNFEEISEDHNISIKQFEDQLDESKIATYEDGTLQRLDPSVIHSAPIIPAPGGVRSFLKVSFSNAKYNLVGNSHNYLFDYDWPLFTREQVRNDPARAGQ